MSRAARKLRDDDAAGVFSALGDGTRLGLVQRLKDGKPRTATELAEATPVTRQAVMKHLRVLEDAGLVVHQVEGRAVLYALEPERLDAARAFLDAISAAWDRRLERLRALVEEEPPAKRR
jgi:DNA-binding transcriptional ArsR family regulator